MADGDDAVRIIDATVPWAVVVRLAGPGDVASVRTLLHWTFVVQLADLVPPSSIADETEEDLLAMIGAGQVYVATVNGAIVGTVRLTDRGDHLYLGRLAVTPSQQSRGIGGALIRFAREAAAPRAGLGRIVAEVRAALPDNVRLFERHGFRVTGRHPIPRHPAASVIELTWVAPTGEPSPGVSPLSGSGDRAR